MNAKYVDAHCHLQFEQYDEDREEIIRQMGEKGVAGIVVGIDLDSSQKAVALAEACGIWTQSPVVPLKRNTWSEELLQTRRSPSD